MPITATLSNHALLMLNEAALIRGMTQREALYFAISTFHWLTKEEHSGGEIAVVKGNKMTRVEIRRSEDRDKA